MDVAITGGTGFIGSHCVSRALAAGHGVRMLVRNPVKAASALALHGIDPAAVEVVTADLDDHPALRAGLEGVDAVVHVAAVFSFKASDGGAMLRTNPSSTSAILEAAAEFDIDPVVRWVQAEVINRYSISIGGGTTEVQKNNLGERSLGLPREPRSDKDVPWRDVPRS